MHKTTKNVPQHFGSGQGPSNARTANLRAFEAWAETHVLRAATFWWRGFRSEGECRLEGRTYNEALMEAKRLGFKEPRWFKPWTWANGVVTVG